MKSPYVNELEPNQVITATLLVQQKEVRQKKTGEPYLTLSLGDRTGDLDARMWDNAAEVIDTFDRDDFIRVRGLMQIHHGRLQLTVHKLARISPESLDQSDFFPASSRDLDQMVTELRQIVEGIGTPPLQELLRAIVYDPEVVSRLRVAPAAKTVHHAFIGGLLEHVLSMCSVAKLLGPHYRDIDLDLLLAGVILHDIGKIHELTYERSFGYSSVGQLLGHIHIGIRMIDDKIRDIPGFPDRLRILLHHMILSHHGELEYGSPKVPLFPEALLLHHIDNLDSKMECMRASIEKDRLVETCWTSYVSPLDRSVLKKQKYLDTPEAAPKTEAAIAGAPQPPVTAGVETVVPAPLPRAPIQPAHPAPLPAPPTQPPHRSPAFQRATSAFAEKLKGALGRDS